jgi:hypothetical protein
MHKNAGKTCCFFTPAAPVLHTGRAGLRCNSRPAHATVSAGGPHLTGDQAWGLQRVYWYHQGCLTSFALTRSTYLNSMDSSGYIMEPFGYPAPDE